MEFAEFELESLRAEWARIGERLAAGRIDPSDVRQAADLLASIVGATRQDDYPPFWDSPSPLCIFDPETGRALAVNPASQLLYGYSEEEFLRMTVFDIHAPEDIPRLKERLHLVNQGGTPSPHDIWHHHRKDGSELLAEMEGHWIVFRGRRARLAMAKDVTARERALDALRLSEERFKLVARASKDAVWDWNLKTDELWWSEGMNSLFGYENAEPSIQWWLEQIHPDDADRVGQSFHDAVYSTENYWSDEYRFRRHDKSYAFVYDRGYVIRDDTGLPLRMVGGITDLSSWHQAQAALRASEERFQLLSRATNDAVWDWDVAADRIWYNEAFYRLFRFHTEEVRPHSAWRNGRVLATDREIHHQDLELALLGNGEIHRAEYRFKRGDGSWASVYDRAVILRDANGKATRLVGSMKDESDREETLRQLAASESKFRRLFSSDLIGVVFSDTNGYVVEANDYFLHLLGYSQKDLHSGDLRWDSLTPAEFVALDQSAVTDLITRGRCEPFEKEFLHRDGSRVPVVIGAAMLEGDATRTVAFVLDNAEKVAGRRALERANQELEQRVSDRTRELETLYVRQAAIAELELAVDEPDNLAAVFRRLRDDLARLLPASASAAVVLPHCLREELPPVDEETLGYLKDSGFEKSFLVEGLLADGEPVVVPDTAAAPRWRAEWHPCHPVRSVVAVPLQSGQETLGALVAFHGEPRTLSPADIEFLQVLARRASQAIVRARLTARLRRANEELRRAKEGAEAARQEADTANHAKSEFISRMSHELRTPLNAILGFAQLLQLHSPTEEQGSQIRQIISGGRHLLTLINEVLDIARIEAGRMSVSMEQTNITDVLRDAIQMIRPSLQARSIEVIWEPDADCDRWAVVDQNRLRQVLLNLLSNAVKYNRERGTIRLGCGNARAGFIGITITDTGVGIPEEKMRRLFVPFDRLGMEGSTIEGSGLGLALSKRLTDIMRGHLQLDSIPGRGTTAFLEFVQSDPPPGYPADKMASGEGFALGANAFPMRTVLYIEDNAANIALLERIFALSPGIRLITAREGARGVLLAESEKPDLVLLDLNLPDVDGATVLQQLQANAETRSIPVIVVSADALPSQRERLKAAGAIDYITKPFNVLEFLATIRRVLGTY